jgi:hypothetical protein
MWPTKYPSICGKLHQNRPSTFWDILTITGVDVILAETVHGKSGDLWRSDKLEIFLRGMTGSLSWNVSKLTSPNVISALVVTNVLFFNTYLVLSIARKKSTMHVDDHHFASDFRKSPILKTFSFTIIRYKHGMHSIHAGIATMVFSVINVKRAGHSVIIIYM